MNEERIESMLLKHALEDYDLLKKEVIDFEKNYNLKDYLTLCHYRWTCYGMERKKENIIELLNNFSFLSIPEKLKNDLGLNS